MKRLAAALLLWSIPAFAADDSGNPSWTQGGYLNCSAMQCQFAVNPPRAYPDDNIIGHAMNICEAHSHEPSAVYMEGRTPREYDNGWESCNRIRREWEGSETARKEREARDTVERDRVYIEELARSMGK